MACFDSSLGKSCSDLVRRRVRGNKDSLPSRNLLVLASASEEATLSFVPCDKLKTKVVRGWKQQSAKLQMVSEQLGCVLFTNSIHKNERTNL